MGERERKQRAMSRMVSRFEASGLTCEEFCRRRRMSVSKLSYWRRKRRGGGEGQVERGLPREDRGPRIGGSLVPLSLVLGAGEIDRTGPSFEIVLLDGRRLVVPEDFSSEGLRRLLEVVGC